MRRTKTTLKLTAAATLACAVVGCRPNVPLVPFIQSQHASPAVFSPDVQTPTIDAPIQTPRIETD